MSILTVDEKRRHKITMLTVEGVQAGYGENLILHDVTMDIVPGQIICLMGRNGVGKTTLLKRSWVFSRLGQEGSAIMVTTSATGRPIAGRGRASPMSRRAVAFPPI